MEFQEKDIKYISKPEINVWLRKGRNK